MEPETISLESRDFDTLCHGLVPLGFYASYGKGPVTSLKDDSMYSSEIHRNFTDLVSLKHRFRPAASSHLSVSAIRDKSAGSSKSFAAVVWELSGS